MPKHLKMYDAIIKDQESRGFIKRANDNCERGSVHYIPHHPRNPQQLQSELFLIAVLNHQQNHRSLNKILHPGPTFVNDLCSIFIRFRQHNVAFLSDIEKAFLHWWRQRFYFFQWLSDPCDISSSLRFQFVLFGGYLLTIYVQATLTVYLLFLHVMIRYSNSS